MSEYADGYDDGKGAVFDELMVDITTLREQLKDCSAVVDRQQKQLDRNQEKEDTGTTHYAGCVGAGPKHYECALQEVGRLRLTITHLRAELAKAQSEYICTCGIRVTPHKCPTDNGF